MEIQKWREILIPYELAVSELEIKFNHMIKESRMVGRYSYIEQVHGRVKTLSSILDKAKRKGIDVEEVTEKICDIAGIRLICQFVEDIEKVVQIIRERSDMEIVEEIDYVKESKPSGYRSYHMIVEIPVFFSKGKTPMRVELQIRTNGMDFWATLEHQLRYKKGIEDLPGYDEISAELLRSAQAVIETDNEMQRIKDKIGMFHDI